MLLRTAAGAAFLTLLFTSCAGLTFTHEDAAEKSALQQTAAAAYPETSFIVISDPHYFDISLGTEGPDFEAYMNEDRKMLVESREILLQAMSMMKGSPADFVIIPGDLTKDGELVCHKGFASHLKIIEEAGYPVYVVPGNHDIHNPHAVAFTQTGHEMVDTVTPEIFAALYNDYGYAEALARDPDSLSYVAEPVEGLWLLALDSCDYRNNFKDNYPQTNGRFTQETIQWIESILLQALEEEKSVIAMMHHGAVEHYSSQEKHYGDYIVDDFQRFSEMLALYNVRVVFTGHYHAQDITGISAGNNKFLFDIETGSLVTYPSPVRSIHIGENQVMEVSSHFVQILPSLETAGIDFPAYSREFVHNGIISIARGIMKDLLVKQDAADRIAPMVADAVVAHYRGDEVFPGGDMLPEKKLGLMGKVVIANRRSLAVGLWNDLPPADNDVIIDLQNGEWKKK